MKPILKWAGGKSQLLNRLIPLFPSTADVYYEPFIGGGSVFLAVLENKELQYKRFHLSDANPVLIQFYRAIQGNVDELIHSVEMLINEYNGTLEKEAMYYQCRLLFRETPTPALFLFLNRTCFRGLYREGPRGFNVPFGHYTQVSSLESDLRRMHLLFNRCSVQFEHQDFREALKNASLGDFVYLDPPYIPQSDTSFTRYTARDFAYQDHIDVLEWCASSPCSFVLSNSDVPLVREKLSPLEFGYQEVSARRAIHCKQPSSRAQEVIVKPF